MDDNDKVPEAVEDQRLRRYGPLVPPRGDTIVFTAPWADGGGMDNFRNAFLRQFAEGLTLPYDEFVRRYADGPTAREQEDSKGARRLARAQRLIMGAARATQRGQVKRKMKRARRLHRLVYGPYYAESRIMLPYGFARTAVAMRAWTESIGRAIFAMGKLAGNLKGFPPVILSPARKGKTFEIERLRGSKVHTFRDVKIRPVFFDPPSLGESYMPPVSTHCQECGLPLEECNRRARARFDKERFRQFERRVAEIQRRGPPLSNVELLQGIAGRMHRNVSHAPVSVCPGKGRSATFRIMPRDRFRRFEARVHEIQEQAAITRAVQDAIADGVVRGVERDTFDALYPEGDFGIFDPSDKTWVEQDPPLVEGALAGFVDDEEEAGLWSEAEATRIALLLDEPGKLQVRRLFVLGRNC